MSGCSCDQTTDEPAPSLHTHYRCFITTTSWSASASASVLDASQFPLLGALPLAPTPCGERALYRHTPSHVSCSSRRSDSRRLHAGHRLANKRAPARLIPGLCTHPSFDAISYFSTLPQRFARARLPDPRLTALTPPFSSIAPHNGLQPMQHRGGLTPPPAGRRRRATKPSSTTQHCLKKVYLHPTPLRRSWHTCMKRFANNGEIADPWGVPRSRPTRTPSGCCIGAASHRRTYNRIQR